MKPVPKPVQYVLAFLLIFYLVAYPQVLGILRCDEAMTAREKDVPDEIRATLAGMTAFRGHLVNVDTNILFFELETSYDSTAYFATVEALLTDAGWSIQDGTGEARAYLKRHPWGDESVCRITYFTECLVSVVYSPYYPCGA